MKQTIDFNIAKNKITGNSDVSADLLSLLVKANPLLNECICANGECSCDSCKCGKKVCNIHAVL